MLPEIDKVPEGKPAEYNKQKAEWEWGGFCFVGRKSSFLVKTQKREQNLKQICLNITEAGGQKTVVVQIVTEQVNRHGRILLSKTLV